MFNIDNDFLNIQNNDDLDSEIVKENQEEQEKDASCTLELRNCQEELGITKDRFARLTADFQNYKKRAEYDRIMVIDRSRSDLLLGILSVVDNFDRALEEAKSTQNPELLSRLVGFELIHKGLYDFLAAQRVTPITQVQTFDPTMHEAISQVTVPDYRSGDIVTVFEKGFMCKDVVLRTAKVSVAA